MPQNLVKKGITPANRRAKRLRGRGGCGVSDQPFKLAGRGKNPRGANASGSVLAFQNHRDANQHEQLPLGVDDEPDDRVRHFSSSLIEASGSMRLRHAPRAGGRRERGGVCCSQRFDLIVPEGRAFALASLVFRTRAGPRQHEKNACIEASFSSGPSPKTTSSAPRSWGRKMVD